MCFVPLDLRVSLNFAHIYCLKLNFKLFFLTDVSNYCEERKIKLSVNVYIKIARNLGSNVLITHLAQNNVTISTVRGAGLGTNVFCKFRSAAPSFKFIVLSVTISIKKIKT